MVEGYKLIVLVVIVIAFMVILAKLDDEINSKSHLQELEEHVKTCPHCSELPPLCKKLLKEVFEEEKLKSDIMPEIY